MFEPVIAFMQKLYGKAQVPLHEPRFLSNEQAYVQQAIESTFVSSVGEFVGRFEQEIAGYTGAQYAIATVNGTAALHVGLMLSGVRCGDEVITQPLTFVATCNAIRYCGASPVFVDVCPQTMSVCPFSLEAFLQAHAFVNDQGECVNKTTGKVIRACVPMHTFGHPANLHKLIVICETWQIALVEDAAESLGSLYHGQHTGTFGRLAAISFNGNKIITTGGGGMLLTNDEALAKRAKHLTTTARVAQGYEFVHDEMGFNYRMPNLNAALGVAQLEMLPAFIEAKRELAYVYADFFGDLDIEFISEPAHCRSNYWLNTLLMSHSDERDLFLRETNAAGVMTRPVWKLMPDLPMFAHCQSAPIENARWLAGRLVNIPSSALI
jgi:aminotransferase in exopolysaccharide biosynthesis